MPIIYLLTPGNVQKTVGIRNNRRVLLVVGSSILVHELEISHKIVPVLVHILLHLLLDHVKRNRILDELEVVGIQLFGGNGPEQVTHMPQARRLIFRIPGLRQRKTLVESQLA